MFEAPICFISLIDDKDLVLKAVVGVDATNIRRASELFRQMVASDGMFAIEDAGVPDRFGDNPHVTGSSDIRFFAGALLEGTEPNIRGGICIGDRVPRTIPADQQAMLQKMAVIAAVLLQAERAEARGLLGTDEKRQHVVETQTRDLKLRERRFQQTERIAKVGGWEFDPIADISVWSDGLYRIHGYPIGVEIGLDLGIAMYASSDRERIAGLLQRLATQGVSFDEEFEIVTPAGEHKFTRVCGEAEIIDGVVRRLFGSTQDITQRRLAELDLKRRERQFLRTEELAQTGGWQFDIATRKCHWSEEIYRIHEIPIGTVITLDIGPLIYSKHERRRIVSLLERAGHDGRGFDEEFELRLPSGVTKLIRTIAEVEMVEGVPTRIFGITQDVTRLRETERALKVRERQFMRTEQLAKVGGWDFDPATGKVLWSDELYRILGISIGTERTRETIFNAYSESDRQRMTVLIKRMCTGEIADFDEEFEMILPTGERKWTRVCAEAELANGLLKRISGTTQDITERRAAERELWHAANHDPLTGLANRAQFADRIGALFARRDTGSHLPGEGIGLLMIDVDRLKEVNDAFGHATGDLLLQTVSARLLRAIGDEGRVARIGGDEFVVTLDGLVSSARLAEVSQAIISAMQPKLQRDGHTLSPQVSIGAAFALEGDTAELLRQKADLALYECKKGRRGSYIEFREDLRTGILQRIGTVRSVDEALTDGRILPYYQPIVALQTGEIGSLEALARMRMPDGRMISAGAFHESLEDHRIAYRLTGQMLAQIAADMRSWLDAGLSLSRVNINVTSADLQAGDFRSRLSSAFGRYGIPLTCATVEVTEMVFMNGKESAVVQDLQKLRDDGVMVALDDFGTGYASLTHLRTLPVDVLKIDKSFVKSMFVDAMSGPIIEALSGLACKVGMQLVAEGIGTAAHAERLRVFGCQWGQGFLFAHPSPPGVAAELLRRFRKHPDRDGEGCSSMRLTA